MKKIRPTFFKIGLISLFFGICQPTIADYRTIANATLYSGPSTQAPIAHQALHAQSKVRILSTKQGFSLIKTNNDELGWIKSTLLKKNFNQKKEKDTSTRAATNQVSTAHASRRKNAVVEFLSEKHANQSAEIPGTIIPSASSTSDSQQAPKKNPQKKIINSIEESLTKKIEESRQQGTDTTNKDNNYIFDSSPKENRIELLSEENKHLRGELEKAKNYILTTTPSNSSSMLFEENEVLNSKLELLRSENILLKEKNIERNIFNKLLILIGGSLLGFLLSKFLLHRNKKNNW